MCLIGLSHWVWTLFNGTSSAGRTWSVAAGRLERHIFVLIPKQSWRQITPITSPMIASTIMPAMGKTENDYWMPRSTWVAETYRSIYYWWIWLRVERDWFALAWPPHRRHSYRRPMMMSADPDCATSPDPRWPRSAGLSSFQWFYRMLSEQFPLAC